MELNRITRIIESALRPLRRRLSLMITRAVGRLVDPATLMQTVQLELMAGEVRNGVEHYEAYGFTSNPLKGFEAIGASINGNRDHLVCLIAADRRYRPLGLKPGEVCLHTDEDKAASQHRVYFKRGQEIHLVAGASSIVMTPTGVTITTPNFDIVKG